MGPLSWGKRSAWPRIWWNLNAQLTYWPQLVSNHLDLGESLIRALDTHKEALAANARPYSEDSYALGRSCSFDLVRAAGPEIGNLPWALHNYWLQYRFSMDDRMLRDRLFPLLKGSVNFYLHQLKEGPDGTLDKLVPYPTNENGYRISASMPFAVSHRHYSHLLMVYPLYLVTPETAKNRELIEKSLHWWQGMPDALRGYSHTGGSSISALLGRGNDAVMYLNRFLDAHRYGALPNTMYVEAGPVVETPLSAAKSLQDMILTSWGGKIRVFPAVPDAWKDVSFKDLRVEGAFLVSSVRKDGKTQFIGIQSLAGEPCCLVTDMPDPKGEGVTVKKVGEKEYELDLQKGHIAILAPGGTRADLTIAPVASQKNRENYYGLK